VGFGSGGGGSQSGSHTYVVKPPAHSGVSGINVTIVSPVAIPTSLAFNPALLAKA
jgi:hypothetical protein